MRIVYITEIDINAAGAAMYRARLFIKGLRESDINCVSYVVEPVCRFLKFGLIGRFASSIIRYYKSFLVLKKLQQGDIVIIYGQNPFICYGKKLKRKGITIVAERTEFPFDLINENSSIVLAYQADVYRSNLHYADYFITCSDALEEYYRKFTSAFMVKLPLLLDLKYLSEFFVVDPPNNYTITYCGDMGNNKDGLPILIDAFAIAAKKNPKLKLLLIGDSSSPGVLEQLRDKIAEYLLTDRVVFMGKITHAEVLHYLATSALCVLARPDNIQAKGGIPSKMGEYLGLGRPSLFTKVGDIPKMLINNQTAFLCQAGNAELFSQAIIDIFNNYDHALVVGRAGKQYIEQFDYRNVVAKLKIELIK